MQTSGFIANNLVIAQFGVAEGQLQRDRLRFPDAAKEEKRGDE